MCLGGAPEAKDDPMAGVLAEIGAKEWKRYQQDFAPVEGQFIGEAEELGSGRERQFLKGMAETELRQKSGQASPSARPSMLMDRARRTGKTSLEESGTLQGLGRKAKGLGTAIGLGRDIGAGALGRIGRHAQIGTSSNIADAEARGIKQQGVYDAVGTAAGYGLYKYGQPGDMNFESTHYGSGGPPRR